MSVAIGIDLGTTNTVVAAVINGVAVTLEDEQGRRLLPSIVSFHPTGTVLVGDAARDRRLIDPESTIYSVKPLLGRTFASDEVKAAIGRFPFQLVEGAKNSTMVTARDVAYALPEISAFVLRRAKAIAERALGQPVDRAVITVPANFNDLQRASTKIAGKLAGLEVLRILNEPTAAALAYGQSIARAEKIAVYDLGGGTFDVTLLDLTGNVFEVLATAGDTALGGDDIDRLLAERMSVEVTRRFNVDPRATPVVFGRLRIMAEELKKELSSAPVAQREITGIGYGDGGRPILMPYQIARDELERLALPLIERTIQVARHSIGLVGLHPKDFDRVILVGGSTRMPLVVRMVEQVFGKPPHVEVNPDEVVALGAAIQAHALSRKAKSKPSAHDALAGATAPEQAPKAPPSVPQELQREASAAASKTAPPSPGAAPSPPSAPDFLASPTTSGASRGSPSKPSAQDSAGPPGPPAHEAARQVPSLRIPAPTSRGVSPWLPPIPDLLPSARSPHPAAAPRGPRPDLRREASVPPAPVAPPAPTPSPGPPLGVGQPWTADDAAIADLGAIVAAAINDKPLVIDGAAFARGSAIATTAGALPLLIDVTPLSLRVETAGGYSDVLVEANSPVPCEKSRTFLTASDDQTLVKIRVAQGEGAKFADNQLLGELELSGLRSARRGEVTIMVTFELDADGLLNVRAKDKETERETVATMRLLGAATDPAELAAMAVRQAGAVVA